MIGGIRVGVNGAGVNGAGGIKSDTVRYLKSSSLGIAVNSQLYASGPVWRRGLRRLDGFLFFPFIKIMDK